MEQVRVICHTFCAERGGVVAWDSSQMSVGECADVAAGLLSLMCRGDDVVPW